MKMNKRQKEILKKLFDEQQKLSLQLFKKELETCSDHTDYKEGKMLLEMSIYDSKKSLKNLDDIF